MSWSRHRPCRGQGTRLPGFGLAPESGLIPRCFGLAWEAIGGRLVVNVLVTPSTLQRPVDSATRIRAGAPIRVASAWTNGLEAGADLDRLVERADTAALVQVDLAIGQDGADVGNAVTVDVGAGG